MGDQREGSVVKPRSFALQVANLILFGIGLYLVGVFVMNSRSEYVGFIGVVAAVLAYYPIRRAYNMVKERRLQRYGEEIERRMQAPPN